MTGARLQVEQVWEREELEFSLDRVSLKCLVGIQLEMSSRLLKCMHLEFWSKQALEIFI